MTCCYMTTNETKIKTDKQTNKQTNKKILTVLGGGTWSFLLGSQSENDYIEIPKTVALVINWWALPLDPANICWSWRRLQHVFSVTILRLPRRLEDVLKTCLEDVLKTCLEDVLKTCLEDVLKTCLEDVLKTCLEDVLKTLYRQAKYLLGISVSNISNVYLTNLCLTNLHLTILRRIQNTLSRAHHFNIFLIFELKQHLCFKN